MGKPARGNARAPPPEHIGREEATRGTETSKYPEERKSTEIPLVAASERGPAQTHARVSLGALPHVVLRGCSEGVPEAPLRVTKRGGSGTAWNGRRNRVTAPYANPHAPR